MIEFGAHKLPLPVGVPREERIRYTRGLLSRALNMKTTVAVAGSGCTIPLGYPTWQEFTAGFVRTIAASLRAIPANERIRREIERFEGFLRRFESPEPLSSDSLMFYITACQQALELGSWERNPYHDYVRTRFSPRERPASGGNPCEFLVDLPISRFVTTNYDLEIEQALARSRGVPRWKLGLEPPPRSGASRKSVLSFTQEGDYASRHICFALSRGSENRNMVFHCHGRYDRPDSLIASEADYQHWYVSEREDEVFAFGQTMDLLFRSNPLLFVGYGLREPDLLRPLRQLGAVAPEQKQTHPIFALLPSKATEEDEHQAEALFERYGVHVIPYAEPPNADARARGDALCKALLEIKQQWDESRDDWVRKPAVRPPSVESRQRDPLLIPNFDAEGLRRFEGIPVPDRLEQLLKHVRSQRPRVIGLIGASGSGKSWHTIQLIKRLRDEPHDFRGIFYWNTHFANEAITALDLALAYLDPDGATRGTREDRLRQCLETPFLLIVDGCERLLRPGDQPREGSAFGPGFSLILKALVDPRSRSTAVLSGRLWPRELAALAAQPGSGVVLFELETVRTEELAKYPPFDSLPRSDVSALSSLLNGHNYGLLLAGRYLALAAAGSERLERAKGLQRKLAERAPQKRFGAMIDYLLRDLDQRTGGVGLELLEHLSLFLEPIREPTLRTCFERACAEKGIAPTQELYERLLDQLESYCLVATLQEPDSRSRSYAAHPLLSDHLRRSEFTGRPDVLPDFSLSAYTAATRGIDPGSLARVSRIDRLFDRLYGDIRAARDGNLGEQARNLCRDAYGLLRSHHDAGAAARWRNYDDYVRPGIRLVSLIKEIAEPLWSYCDPHELRSIESPASPLYIGELAWLYNDLGLALFCEGYMQDAYAVWEQGYEINHVLEAATPYGEFVLESLLNLTHALIELGRVKDAAEYLEKASRLSVRLRDRGAEGRILGYQGFREHISGNLQTADVLYQDCVERVREAGNHRAISFFLTLHAGLKVELSDLDAAADLIRSSRAAAEAGSHPDLVAYSRLPEADLRKRQGKPTDARLEYEAARREAQSHKARALEALVLLKLGDLSLDQGDAEGARRLALQSLNLSNQFSLGLIATRALMVLGRAMLRAGQRELGITYLEIVKQRARLQQYVLRLREAERYLQEEGIT